MLGFGVESRPPVAGLAPEPGEPGLFEVPNRPGSRCPNGSRVVSRAVVVVTGLAGWWRPGPARGELVSCAWNALKSCGVAGR
jgi:hypothetical protein